MSVNDVESAFVKLFRSGEFYFAFALCKLLFEEGMPLLYSILGEKAEIYGTKNEILKCYENAIDKERFHFLTSGGELPEHLKEKCLGNDDEIHFPETIQGLVI